MKILKRMLIAIISWTVFITVLGIISYLPLNEREPDIYYLSFSEHFVYSMVYGTPIYILISVPTSFIVDFLYLKFFRSKINSYLYQLISYSLIGLMIGFILPSDISDIVFMVFNCVLFFHMLLLLREPQKV